MRMRYFLSLGSNLGDRGKNLAQALTFLEEEGMKIIKSSSIYETQPVDLPSQPWFFNQIVEVEIVLNPFNFLHLVKKVEKKMMRKPLYSKGPRIIDIDILLAEGTVVLTKELKIPHPRMEKRNFVLVPLKEISPETLHPILMEKVEDLWKKSRDKGIVKQINKQSLKTSKQTIKER